MDSFPQDTYMRCVAAAASRIAIALAIGFGSGAAVAQSSSYGICDCQDGKPPGEPCPTKCKEPPQERYKIYFTESTPNTKPYITPFAKGVTGEDNGTVAFSKEQKEILRQAAESARIETENKRLAIENQHKEGKLTTQEYKAHIYKYNGSINAYKDLMKDLKASKMHYD